MYLEIHWFFYSIK